MKKIILSIAALAIMGAISVYAFEGGSTYLINSTTTYNPGCFGTFGASCGWDTTDHFGCQGPGNIGCSPYDYTHPHQTGLCAPDPTGKGGGDNGGGYSCV